MNLDLLTINKMREYMKKGDISFSEIAKHFLKKIEEKNEKLNVYLEVFEDVLENAENLDKKIKNREDLDALSGVPFAIKDNILIKGKKAFAGSKILEGYRASFWSTATKKLKEKNSLFLGRANMDEFAMGGSTENSAYGVTKNPHDTERVPGGSSGGSASAVASGMALASLGSDTGGSVRQPASFCGVVGLKPTYGAVSRHGLIAMGSSLDVIGPITKNVEDNEIVYNAIKGKDSMDSTSVSKGDYLKSKIKKKEKMVIGVPTYLEDFDLDGEMVKIFQENLDKLKSKGHKIKKIKLDNMKYALAVYYIIMPAEASSNLARFDGVKYGAKSEGKDLMEDYIKTRGELFGKEVRRRIYLGTYVLSAGYYDAYYKKAKKVRTIMAEDFKQAFDEVDVIATPTAPTPAFKIGEKSDPLSMYMSDIFTAPANLTGNPAISVPMGEVLKGESKLPVGIQFVSSHMREDLLFQVGKEIFAS